MPIRAEVVTLQSLSGHADADEIVAWIGGATRKPKITYVTHGEPDAADVLRGRISRELGWQASVRSICNASPWTRRDESTASVNMHERKPTGREQRNTTMTTRRFHDCSASGRLFYTAFHAADRDRLPDGTYPYLSHRRRDNKPSVSMEDIGDGLDVGEDRWSSKNDSVLLPL